jgi:wyosine [tRNA(Phe)-imidazoG37] synthetase (radical SAM superfamily)
MGTFLFDEIIFGPVRSRRLGVSLGVNLLPADEKWCNFNCIYCECGWTTKRRFDATGYPSREEIRMALDARLSDMLKKKESLDVITFAGNGEPTMHPAFAGIIDDTIELRNHYFQNVEIAVLSNSTMTHLEEVRQALGKVEQNILKLDSAIPETFALLNQPQEGFSLDQLLENLSFFSGNFILQTMFVRGIYRGKLFDNTSERELEAWLCIVRKLSPKKVMIYTIARDTPAKGIEKIPIEKLNEIAGILEQSNIPVQISG